MHSRACVVAVLVLAGAPRSVAAQPGLAERVRSPGTRTVAFTARSRPEVCGDGRTSYSDGLSVARSRVYDGVLLSHAAWDLRIPPCERGPMRVTIRVVEGEPARLRVAVGPVAALPGLADSVVDLGGVSTAEASAFLRDVVRRGEGRAATDAMLPLVLLDSAPRWETLAAAAGDTTRLVRYRRRAADLLARAAAFTLGPVPAEDDGAAGDLRREAVNALAHRRQPMEDPVPQLLALARDNPHREIRVAALYQLGQTGDPRAVPLFASMLGVRTQ